MKRIISIVLLVVVLASMLAACGSKFTCDMCGLEKSGKKYESQLMGEQVLICKDCHDAMEELVDAFS